MFDNLFNSLKDFIGSKVQEAANELGKHFAVPEPAEPFTLICYILCCWFTKLYLPVNIVRMDERTGNIFFLAGEANIIEIYPNGRWRYMG